MQSGVKKKKKSHTNSDIGLFLKVSFEVLIATTILFHI